jgi:hypothetical protein
MGLSVAEKKIQIRRTTDVVRERKGSLRVYFCLRKNDGRRFQREESLEPFQVVNDALETT